MERNNENGILLPFRQDADFYCRCACRYLDEDNTLLAAQYARKAYQMEPENPDCVITLAEALNRMHRFEESTQLLLLLGPFDTLPQDALLGLAANFMGLEEFAIAEKCAEQCMNTADDPETVDRAAEFLDILEDRESLEIQIGLAEGEDCALLEGIRIAKALQISGKAEEALALLRELKKKYEASDILDMELATLLYSMRTYREAEQILFGVFKRDSRHIRAHLLMAILYRAEGKRTEAQEELDRTYIDPDASPEELGYAGVVFLEFGLIERARDALERLREFLPFDKDMLHQLGYCCLKLGDREKAEEAYRTLKRSDESDTVAEYYEEAIRTQPEESFLKNWSIHYEVPMTEYLARRERLQNVATSGEDAIKLAWKNDPSFRALIRWALFSVIVPFRKAVMHMLSVAADAEAEALLRQYLMSYLQPDDEKQFALGVLLAMGAKPPFSMYLSGAWQYGGIAPIEVPDRMPRTFAYILWNIRQLEKRAVAEGADCEKMHLSRVTDTAERIFLLYVNTLNGRYPRLTPLQQDAFSAAFLLLAAGSMDEETITPEMLADWYHVSHRRLENAISRIFRQLKEKES